MKNLFKKLTNKSNRGLDDNNHLHHHQTPPPQPQPQPQPPPPPPQPSFSPSASAQNSPANSSTEPPLAYPYSYQRPLQQGGVMNSGSSTNGWAQKQEDGKEDNEKKKSGGVIIGKIGGNHGNTNGTNVTGHITLGNIG